MSKRRGRTDAVMHNHRAIAAGLEWIDPPDGVELRDEVDCLIWAQFTLSRLVNDWTAADLVQLGKIVMLESDLRKLTQELHDGEGYMLDYTDSMGNELQKENPIVSTIDKVQKQQLSIIRSMGLNTPPTDPRTMEKARKNAQNYVESLGDDPLLAQPSRH